MQARKTILALMVAVPLILGAGMALAATEGAKAPEGTNAAATPAMSKAEVHRIRGEVTGVEPSATPSTLTMKTMEGKQELTVGVDVTDKTIIREGKSRRTLADIKAGARVWMRYERADRKLIADYIRILKPAHVAPKSASTNMSY